MALFALLRTSGDTRIESNLLKAIRESPSCMWGGLQFHGGVGPSVGTTLGSIPRYFRLGCAIRVGTRLFRTWDRAQNPPGFGSIPSPKRTSSDSDAQSESEVPWDASQGSSDSGTAPPLELQLKAAIRALVPSQGLERRVPTRMAHPSRGMPSEFSCEGIFHEGFYVSAKMP